MAQFEFSYGLIPYCAEEAGAYHDWRRREEIDPLVLNTAAISIGFENLKQP